MAAPREQRIVSGMLRAGLAAAACLAALSDARAGFPIILRDVTDKTGITFRHTDGSSGSRYIMEAMSAGMAIFDYDGDGDADIYFLNGAPLKGARAGAAPTNALYRNDGGFKFTDVTKQARVGDRGFGLGVCAGDYDNDGDLDLYLNNFGPNVLYRNNGDGTFTDVTKQAGVANGRKVGAGVCFLDMDGDGDLDLYVANYVRFDYKTHRQNRIHGVSTYVGPMNYPPEPDTLYRNDGDGTFTDVSAASGVGKDARWGMGMVCADYDGDGDTDVFVGNDVSFNALFRNDGTGKFEDVGLPGGVAVDVAGNEQGSMGIECGDYDNDGWLDFHQTSYDKQLAVLFRNLGDGSFEDVTLATRVGAGTEAQVTWGNGLVDFDSDGDRDLFIACGHIQDNVEKFDDTQQYLACNLLLMNTGDGKFVNVSDRCGDGLAVKLASRGAAFDDLDNDGDIDVVILNSRREPTVLRNDSPAVNHWLQVHLRGTKTNRDGVGAHVKVTAGHRTQIAEVHSGRAYQSHYGMRLHFGLGKQDRIDRVEVRWIGGGVDVLKDVPADRLLTIQEGKGIRGASGATRRAP